jgi:hypothetical protein
MNDTISAALISAVASIVVAFLSKGVEAREDSKPQNASSIVVQASSRANAWWWYVTSAILLIWFAFSPAFVHHDFAGMNFWLIPVGAIVLALIVPTLPLRAAWISLALFAANFFLGPLSNRLHGSQYDTQFLYSDPRAREEQLSILLIGFGTAAVAFCICYFRLRLRRVNAPQPTTGGEQIAVHPTQTQGGLAAELEKLAQLHAAGTLSVDEFKCAKKKLLDSR